MTVILMLVSADDFYIHHSWKELGTMEVLLVSPLNPLQVILGKVFPYIFLWLMRP
jgi:ABC-2 type transport system permease protein